MKREIRSSAVVGLAGVGAIIDVGEESFVIPGIGLWQQKQLRVIDLPRLGARLHRVLKAPREIDPQLRVNRFPRAMFCEKCRRLVKWKTSMEVEGSAPLCKEPGCHGKLVPMRFVSVCEQGHLGDVDWFRWAHSGPGGNRGCRDRDQLYFVVDSGASGGGLASLKVECRNRDCKSSRDLGDITARERIRHTFGKCSGSHPWIFGRHDDCAAEVQVLQRGATNLHYPRTISALDIPADLSPEAVSEFAAQIQAHKRFRKLLDYATGTEGDNEEFLEIYIEAIARDVGCDEEVIRDLLSRVLAGENLDGDGNVAETREIDQEMLLGEEWRTIRAALDMGTIRSANFIAHREEPILTGNRALGKLLKGVLLVERLREVRAYLGFHRVTPGDPAEMVRPDVGGEQNWLPASEVFGEGIVLELDFDLVSKWASALPAAVTNELAALEGKRTRENLWFLPEVDAGFLAMHVLSHLLLRQITFECGYSSSSLRERLYYSGSKRFAGIMIYTAEGDSEGSLGGLVRQGRSDRLMRTLIEAVDNGRWCSADPVCFETAGQGLGGFNHAACHACCLVSETSCVASNTLLDRRMLFHAEWGLLAFADGCE